LPGLRARGSPVFALSRWTMSSGFDGSNHGFGDWSFGTNATLLPSVTTPVLGSRTAFASRLAGC
jgi:hypothetical protein